MNNYKYILCVEDTTGRMSGRLGYNRTKCGWFLRDNCESQVGVPFGDSVRFKFPDGRTKELSKSWFYGTNWRNLGHDADLIVHRDLKSLTSERKKPSQKSGQKLYTLAELLEMDD